ncbi:AhpD family alkylhydroperoxidase [Azospirillum agricola]|uniref:carboxymuconolactone decarboxylase family protein n=1 Tax=Azospirillum agricola TaxID=1720247 RepID=UPI001AE74502|nr:carboxymuconolactone decarboxylase family protein [Azospirillum agricola]MBP2232107.1 AhpD family alkylhydroperoxidase [Azospirillum agricola]
MDRQQVYQEIEGIFGLVPSFFKELPDNTVEAEWRLFRAVQLDDGPLPVKVRELIGLGIAAVTKCRYCVFYHTAIAKLFGASDAEIEAAVHYAKSSAGWSAYLNGLAVDYDSFTREVEQACDFVRSRQEHKQAA